VVLAASPYLAVRAAQPLAEAVQVAYKLWPELGAGLRLPQSVNFCLRTELSALYGAGSGDFAHFKVWSAGLRVSEEFNSSPLFDAHVSAGVMYMYGSERQPEADTLGSIGDRWYSGSGFGVFGTLGVPLARNDGFRLDLEGGLDLGSVLTDRRDTGWGYGYSYLSLATLNVGLVARFGERKPGPEQKPCGCLQ
jgi:hypothetical protein